MTANHDDLGGACLGNTRALMRGDWTRGEFLWVLDEGLQFILECANSYDET
jgi:hypothetical protein